MSAALVVAIDGPAGVGKSTVARRVAAELGWAHLDSGALFRAVAAAALASSTSLDDEEALERLVDGMALRIEPDGRVFVEEEEVTARLRDPDVTAATPALARHPGLRRALVTHQRAFARRAGRVVAEGRDMGTVVFPDALVKVFLEADPAERARRRLVQEHPEAAADAGALATARSRLEARDRADRQRPIAPLVPAADAWRLDTTRMSLDEVVAAVEKRVRSAVPVPPPRESEA